MSERWAELSLLVARRRAEPLSERLMELGATGTQEDAPPGVVVTYRQPWDTGPAPAPLEVVRLRAWFLEEEGLAARIAEALAGELDGIELSWGAVESADWAQAWKAGFTRLVVSERLAVAPPWLAEPGDLVIEPGMAFGTGEHPTTRACLAAVERLARPGIRCLDLGMGTGVLALAAVRLGATGIGVDIDPVAVDAARENAAANGLVADFSTTPIERLQGQYELVVANLFAEVLVALSPHIVRLTGERLALAGILADRAHKVEAAFSSLTLVRRDLNETGEWVFLEYAR
jgi:ribosomal protein L11 methyltransferase